MAVAAAPRMTGAVRILEQHLVGYRRTWRGSVFSTFLTPVLFLASIGIGLGAIVDERSAGNGAMGAAYLAFLAPGILVSSAMQSAASESTYPVMAGIVWDRTYLAALATPLAVADIVIGNLLFVAVRLAIAGTVFIAVAVAFGAVAPLPGLAMLPVSILTGLGFAAAIQAFSSTQRGDQGFTLLFRFVITPLFLFSGTFFPIDQLPDAIRWVAWCSPLWHGIDLARSIALGTIDPPVAAIHLAVLLGMLTAGIAAGVILFRRRLVR